MVKVKNKRMPITARTEVLQTRVSIIEYPYFKEAAEKLGFTMSEFMRTALYWYIEELEKEIANEAQETKDPAGATNTAGPSRTEKVSAT